MLKNTKKNISKIKTKVNYLFVKTQILISVVLLISCATLNAKHNQIISLTYGLAVVNVYVFIFHWALIRILQKKTIALAGLGIVFKWSILWLIIKGFINDPDKNYLFLVVGLSSIVLTVSVYLVFLSFFEERI